MTHTDRNRPQNKLKRWELALLLGVALAALLGVWLGGQQTALADKVIRLHVIANSDSEADQALKLLVRDRILAEAGDLFAQGLSREEAEVRKRYNVTHYDAYFLARVGLPEQPLPEDFPRRIYISFDVDGLDSSLMPATGTPSPGGISWREAQFILERCARDREIVGLDVVELAPIPGLHHANFTAAKLTHLLMALALQGRTDLQGKKA